MNIKVLCKSILLTILFASIVGILIAIEYAVACTYGTRTAVMAAAIGLFLLITEMLYCALVMEEESDEPE